MSEAKTIPAKYVFLDVVGFSRGRSVEAQTDIVHNLNNIVKSTIASNKISESSLIYLPTGDGICLALLNIEDPYDIHIKVALGILESLHEYNEATENEMRKFQVRIGLNANTDNLVVDINNNQNIAGSGINLAQRVMSKADGNQILVSQSVFDTLHVREAYMSSFRSFQAKIKHGGRVPIHQFIGEAYVGLNRDIPEEFKETEKAEPELSLRVACYFAHAIKNREFFLQRLDAYFAIKVILLWLLAGDSSNEIQAKGLSSILYKTYKAKTASFEEQFEYYYKMDDELAFEVATLIQFDHLFPYHNYFEALKMWLINSKGKEKLKREWPNVWEKFNLDEYN